jgi:15-cis-phytoene synthase
VIPITQETAGVTLEEAYSVSREIARREAKNFYYAFLALPAAKRNAICAVYAFMRRADDISDDESISRSERRRQMETWLAEWHAVDAGGSTSNPVFLALKDAKERFGISSRLLDQLVEGTTMDLKPGLDSLEKNASGIFFDTYPTFDDLYRYCYLVASVVGLVCIRIFGYRDSRAEKLAEETGIAFQLTNILRDVQEDAQRGRLYLPLEDLKRFGVKPEEITSLDGRNLAQNQRDLLKALAERARKYYRSAEELLPFISSDSRPALRVLVKIYSRVLDKIEEKNYDVFSARVQVPTYQKLWILSGGLLRVLLNRAVSRNH